MSIGEVTDDDDGNSLSLSTQDEQHLKARVSFRDEELGLSPRHLVTKIYHRPHTTKKEKSLLWYSPQDLKKFRLVEQIHVQRMIKLERRMKGSMATVKSSEQKKVSQSGGNVVDTDTDTMKDEEKSFLDQSIRPTPQQKVKISYESHLSTGS